MTNSRARKGFELLDNHLATGTEATYTYTPTNALDMKLRYKEIIIYITGKVTASLNLELKINAITDYDQSEQIHDSGTVSGGLNAALGHHVLINGSLLDGAVPFMAKVSLILNDTTDTIFISSHATAPHEGNYMSYTEAQASGTSISAIIIETSTSTWIAGTEISTYGVQR